MKFETEHIIEALKETKINNEDIDTVLHRLEQIAEEIKKEKEENKVPRQKKKYLLLNPKETSSYYIMQCEQDYDTNLIVPALQKSIGDYNQRAKKKKVEITNMAEAIEFIPNKILKENGLNIKTKTPCDISTLSK